MTSEDKAAMREHLALNVMGWIKITPFSYHFSDENHIGTMLIEDFDPFTNANQALMVLEKFEIFGITRNMLDEGYYVSIYTDPDLTRDYEGLGGTFCEAICLAACRASGMEI